MSNAVKTIGVLTSGGDAPGMNAAIRAVVRTGIANGLHVKGIRRGFAGLLEEDIFDMSSLDVSDIIQLGGTILYTARCLEFKKLEYQMKGADICRKHGIDGIVPLMVQADFLSRASTRSVFRERSILILLVRNIRLDSIQRSTQRWRRSIACATHRNLMSVAVSSR